jgi:hypothetical protein
MKTRFDLEQEILQCWNILDDLKMLQESDNINPQTFESIRILYSVKFEVLFATFEELLSNKVIE